VSQTAHILRKWWLAIPGVFVLLLLLAVGFLIFRSRGIEERTRHWVVQTLSQRFQSDVDLDAIHIKVFPQLSVAGDGLTLHHHGRRDVPPLIHIKRFTFTAGAWELLHPIKHIPLLHVENMVINIPPRVPKNDQPLPPQSSNKGSPNSELRTNKSRNNESRKNELASRVVVDEIVCDNTDIVIIPQKVGVQPLDWDIHDLVLDSVGRDKPFAFRAHLTNGKPIGEIATLGQFGPWDADIPGDSPVSGKYEFTDADLGPFPGIAGILSSDGKYSGVLSELQVEGHTNTPDFSLDGVGKPISLRTDFSATVDGTNGDTYLHPVNATLVDSLIIAEGSVIRGPEKKGHLITIETTVPNGRIQDFLSLAINSEKPLMTGPVTIKAKLVIPPGNQRALEKMIIDGQFGVSGAKWSNPALREKLESLSRHGQGKPSDEEFGSSVSDLNGSFHLENGVIKFLRLKFSVEGAAIDLMGTYALRKGDIDLIGYLRLNAKLSQTMTGTKSFFLKVIDPFFNKGGAGTVIPIHITGTRDDPVFGSTIFHRTFNRKFSTEQLTPGSKPSPK
jgi:hypothetical protein